jgi:hypothetical protein
MKRIFVFELIKREGAIKMNKVLNRQQKKGTRPSLLCHHVSEGRLNAPKRCMLNHECYHCAYDQWLEAIDLEAGHARGIAEASPFNLHRAA